MVGSSAQRRVALGAMPNDGAGEVVTLPDDNRPRFAGIRLEIEELLARTLVPGPVGEDREVNEYVLGLPVKSITNGIPDLILAVGPAFRTRLTIDEVGDRLRGSLDWTPFCVVPAKR